MKQYFYRYSNRVIAALLAALGFTACDSIGGDEPVEYGTPNATFHFVGQVTDKDGKPIPGIKVTVSYDGQRLYKHVGIKDSTMTDAEGRYQTETFSNFSADRHQVAFEDVDGAANGGEFLPDTVRAKEMQKKQLKKGSGWYTGDFELTADKQLKQK